MRKEDMDNNERGKQGMANLRTRIAEAEAQIKKEFETYPAANSLLPIEAAVAFLAYPDYPLPDNVWLHVMVYEQDPEDPKKQKKSSIRPIEITSQQKPTDADPAQTTIWNTGGNTYLQNIGLAILENRERFAGLVVDNNSTYQEDQHSSPANSELSPAPLPPAQE